MSAEASSQVGKVAVSVALPAAMFLPMASLDVSALRWGVISSVAAAKAGTWLLGALVGYLMGTTPSNRCGAGPQPPFPRPRDRLA